MTMIYGMKYPVLSPDEEAGGAAGDAIQTDAPQEQAEAPAKEAPATTDATPENKPANEQPKADPWGEAWRETYAGEDAGKLSVLKRYSSPKDVIDALFAARAKIQSGAAKEPLPENATPEQVAAWRKGNGIPETADGYLSHLPEGFALGDDDKEGAKDFLAAAHEANVPPSVVALALKSYTDRVKQIAEESNRLDDEYEANARAELEKEWGRDMKANLTAVNNFLDAYFPAEIKGALMGARLGDSSIMFSNPAFLKSMARIAREMNPGGVPMPGQSYDRVDVIDSKIKEYETMMRTDRANWFKDAKAQEHYRELLTARERMKT